MKGEHNRKPSSRKGDRRVKTCPDCAEEVKEAARICRFCGYRFEEASVQPPPLASPQQAPTPTAAQLPEARPEGKRRSVKRPAAWTALVLAIFTVFATLDWEYNSGDIGAGPPEPPGFWDVTVAVVGGGGASWLFFFLLVAGFLKLVQIAEERPVSGGVGAFRRIPVPQDIRWMVFARDGYRCLDCGGTIDLTIDHIHPVVWGGTNDPSNLQTLCRSCNSVKGDSW